MGARGGPRRFRSYRVLLWLYPRWFRREYGDDLVQAFRDELRDRGPLRGWLRVIADLVVSIPTQHREAVMAHRSSSSDLVRLVLVGTAVLALVAFGGMLALASLLVLAALTFARWRRMVPYREALRDSNKSWWRVLLAGVALMATIVVATRYGPDFDWFPWHLLVFLVLTGWALLGVGAALGIATLVQRVRRVGQSAV